MTSIFFIHQIAERNAQRNGAVIDGFRVEAKFESDESKYLEGKRRKRSEATCVPVGRFESLVSWWWHSTSNHHPLEPRPLFHRGHLVDVLHPGPLCASSSDGTSYIEPSILQVREAKRK